MKKITTILFDFDGTLYHHDLNSEQQYWKYVESLGISVTPELIEKTEQWKDSYFSDSPEIKADRALIKKTHESSWRLFTRRQIELFGDYDSDTLDRWATMICDNIESKISDGGKLGDDVIQTLTTLQSTHTLGLITNRSISINPLLESLNILSFFDIVYTAGDVGFWKPSPRIFERALSELEVDTNEVIYVGDSLFADVTSAKAADIIPILIDPENRHEEPDCEVISKISDVFQVIENL